VVKTSDVEVKQSQTKPPARFTEATCLRYGGRATGRDEELREAMSEKALARRYRASIIEGLIASNTSAAGQRAALHAKAFSLMELLNVWAFQNSPT